MHASLPPIAVWRRLDGTRHLVTVSKVQGQLRPSEFTTAPNDSWIDADNTAVVCWLSREWLNIGGQPAPENIHRGKCMHALLPSFLLPPSVFRTSCALIWAEQMDSTDANAMLSSRSFLHGPVCIDTLHLHRSTVFCNCSKRKCGRTVGRLS